MDRRVHFDFTLMLDRLMVDARCHGCLMLDGYRPWPMEARPLHTLTGALMYLNCYLQATASAASKERTRDHTRSHRTTFHLILQDKGKHQTEGTPTTGLGVARGSQVVRSKLGQALVQGTLSWFENPLFLLTDALTALLIVLHASYREC